MPTAAQELGKTLGKLAYQQSRIQENISPDDPNGQFLLFAGERVKVHGRVRVTRKYYLADSFVLDHPVQGYLDSATYKLDGGYDDSQELVVHVQNEGNLFREPLFDTRYVDSTVSNVIIDNTLLTVTFQ
jgi:hypothetical protein